MHTHVPPHTSHTHSHTHVPKHKHAHTHAYTHAHTCVHAHTRPPTLTHKHVPPTHTPPNSRTTDKDTHPCNHPSPAWSWRSRCCEAYITLAHLPPSEERSRTSQKQESMNNRASTPEEAQHPLLRSFKLTPEYPVCSNDVIRSPSQMWL